jgi:DNA-binding CsgD family transcriptional regulator/tetratricopeptide (TPR) repeat protein
MAQLRAALARADSGTAGAVVVSGDAGVGKSRLLDELAAYATERGALVLSGRCLDVGETGLPYLPFAEVITQLQRIDPAAVAARPALGRLLPGSVMPARQEPMTASPPPDRRVAQPERDLTQLQLFDALFNLLGELAEQPGGGGTPGQSHCVLLIVEDMHWADPSTRDLMSFLLSRLRTQRLLIVASYRSDDLHRRHPLRRLLAEIVRLPAVERLDLTPFNAADARQFVVALAERPMTEDLIAQVAERSEGNAFFAEELMDACLDCDGVPTGLADVLLSRIERLSPSTQALVRLASVAGRRVQHSRLQGVAGRVGVEFDDALREAVQHNVLQVDRADFYAFRHALLREAVYADLLPGERVRLHAAYAQQIAKQIAETGGRRGLAAALAHHSLESNDLVTALDASVRAGSEAMDVGAPAEGLRHVEQALKLWDAVSPEERPAGLGEYVLLRRASYLADKAGEPERAAAFARSAVAQVDAALDPEEAAETYRRLAQALTPLENRQQESLDAIEHAWRLVADRPPSRIRSWVLAIRAATLRRVDRQEARISAEAAIVDSRAVGNGGAEADALATLGLLDGYRGEVEASIRHLSEAIGRATDAEAYNTELRARYFLGMHSLDVGKLDDAVRIFDDGVERAKANGMTWSSYGLELRMIQMISKYASGDWDGAEAAAEPPGRQVSDTVLARLAAGGSFVMVGRGRFDEADKLIKELRGHWHRDLEIVMYSSYCGAALYVWRGEPERTAGLVNDVLAWLDKSGVQWHLGVIRLVAWGIAAQVMLAHRARLERHVESENAAMAEGDRLLALAADTAVHGLPWTGELGPEGRAWLAFGKAEHTRLTGAGDPAAWQAAVRAFGYGDVYLQALARLHRAEALLGTTVTGKDAAPDHREDPALARDEAIAELVAANQVAQRLGATPLAAAVAELARRGRLTVPGLAPARDHVDPFTPRERAVLTLVALGRTNRQVGEELYISEKTVSVHLSRIMAKLGASRRAEAVATAYERGLLEPSAS